MTTIGTNLWRWNPTPQLFRARALLLGTTLFLASCATKPPEPPLPPPAPLPPPPVVLPPPVPPPAPALPGAVSGAITPKAYRADAAKHLYSKVPERIYKGRLPPLLYAVGVLDVEIDGRGKVDRITWVRGPTQAPEVMAEIERMVRAAAPFPAPVKMGRTVWTDVWLWHKGGKFQLDTLTEGQD